MAKRFKSIPRTTTVEAAIEDAKAEIEALYEEMNEWAENMESNSMEGLPKYEEVTEARDALEQSKDSPEEIDMDRLPQVLRDADASYTEARPYGRKPEPRWMRLSNCVSMLHAAKDKIEAAEEERNNSVEDTEQEDAEDIDFETAGNAIDEAINYAEQVSFPGMY